MIHIDRPCNFAQWVSEDTWLLEEAVFILLGREPPPRESQLTYGVPHDYEKIEQWLRASIEDGTLAVKQDKNGAVWVSPRAILTWAKREGFPIDESLSNSIENATTIEPTPEKPLQENERRTLLNIIRALAQLSGVEPIKTRTTGDGWRKTAKSLLEELAKKGIDPPCNEKTLAAHLRNSFQELR